MITAGVSGFDEASKKSRWLVGVSGGADSVALLHLLVEQGFSNLVVCHLDHRLRRRASTEDAKFVKRLAAKLGLVGEIGSADVTQRMRECGESMETAARNARHAFFAECARAHRCPRIFLAHHADDQAETVLWNLLRGSHGLKGMRGEQVLTLGKRRMIIHRPLLKVPGRELREWLTARRLAWREDASNAEHTVVRNRLRHQILPLLDEISGRNASQMIARALEGNRALEEIESWAVAQARALDPRGRLHLPALRALPAALQRAVLVDFLKQAGIGGVDRALVSRVTGLLDANSPPAVNLPGGTSIRRRAGRLFIEGIHNEE
jgi:tRNA(Ile)-lysidine synthase